MKEEGLETESLLRSVVVVVAAAAEEVEAAIHCRWERAAAVQAEEEEGHRAPATWQAYQAGPE